MKINDIILLTEEKDGNTSYAVITIQDFIQNYVSKKTENVVETAIYAMQLEKTARGNADGMEMKYSESEKIEAAFCRSEHQLEVFLYLNEVKPELCSKECLDIMEQMGIGLNGMRLKGVQYSYKKLDYCFEQGEILRNFNGSDYRVLEKLDANNLLLLNVDTGQFTVAIGTEMYEKHNKNEVRTEDNCITGIEWNHGIYLGCTPSAIDFRGIRREYGKEMEIKDVYSYRGLQEDKFRQYKSIAEDENLTADVREAAKDAMYEEYGTGKLEAFRDYLNQGKYDGNYSKEKCLLEERNR